MTERVRNIVIAVVLAGTAALLTGLYVTSYQRRVQQGQENATVFVAARAIPAGTSGADAIAKGMIASKVVTKNAVVPGAVTSTGQVRDLVATEQLFAGEQITNNRFSESSVTGIQGELKGTMRAYQLQGDPNQLLAGTLRKGDRVDLVATFRYTIRNAAAANGNDVKYGATRTVLRNLLVLRPPIAATSSSSVTSGFGSGTDIILRVTDAQAQKLDFTINITSRESADRPNWHLTLRSPVQAADSPESVTSLDSVLLDGLGPAQRLKLTGKYQGGN